MSSKYKPLLPAEDKRSTKPPDEPSGGSHPRGRRAKSHIACDRCRVKKVTCDGLRPACSVCVRKAAECIYRPTRNPVPEDTRELQRSLQAREDSLGHRSALFELLRSLPEAEAADLLRRVRSSADLAGLASSFATTTRPSDLAAARAISSATTSATELELVAQYGAAFPLLLQTPVDPAVVGILPTGPDVQTAWMLDGLGPGFPPPMHSGVRALEAPSQPQSSSSAVDANSSATPPARPSPPPEYCDSRLGQLRIGYWIKVPISNELAATLISSYLQTDHAVQGYFDADLFVRDLVACAHTHCSSFLVAAVLCIACEYAAFKPQTSELRAALFREAELLWRGEAAVDSILSVASLGVFGAMCICEGRDALGMELSAAQRGMAERLGLFGDGVDDPSRTFGAGRGPTPEDTAAAAHVAWGAYNWLTIHVVFYHLPHISHAPRLPIPGDPARRRDPPAPARTRFTGRAFPAMCKLWTLAQEVMAVYNTVAPGVIAENVPLGFAEAKYRRLLAWAATLGDDMRRDSAQVPSDVMICHMFFHVIATIILRPYTSAPAAGRLRSFASADSHPAALYAASVRQLRDLVLAYRLRHPTSARLTSYFNPALFTLGLASLEDRADPLWQLYFLLCIRCWRDLHGCFPVFRQVGQALLSMAMQRNALTPRAARSLRGFIEEGGRHHEGAAEALTTFVFDPASAAAGEAQINLLAMKFDDMILFDEFVLTS